MCPPHDRRTFLAATAGIVTAVAGCLGSPDGSTSPSTTTAPTTRPPTDDPPSTTTATSTTTETPPPTNTDLPGTPDAPYPEPPERLTEQTAKETAIEFEETYLVSYLGAQDYDDSGLGGTYGASATVEEQTDDNVYLTVRRGYYYTDGSTHADGVSRATYYVSTDRVVRIRGDP